MTPSSIVKDMDDLSQTLTKDEIDKLKTGQYSEKEKEALAIERVKRQQIME